MMQHFFKQTSNRSLHTGRMRGNIELEASVGRAIERLMHYGIPLNQRDVVHTAQAIQPGFNGAI
jgi:hypothetical protein